MKRALLLALVLLLAPALLSAQEPEQHPAADPHATVQGQEGDAVATPQAHASQAAEHAADPHAEFKESASVRFVGRTLNVSVGAAYWISVLLNFAIIAGLLYLLLRKLVPQVFRERTAAIQKQLEEARRASAEATRRLGEIEGRLARIDGEIAELRSSADSEAAAEEERIRAAAEADKQKIIQAAEQEIVTAGRAARSELKRYAAELAVSLAEKRIQVDSEADQALVRAFVEQLGMDDK